MTKIHKLFSFFFFHLANEKVIIDFSMNGTHPGFLPDGLTIDTDGNLYITFYGGSKISKVDPKSVVKLF